MNKAARPPVHQRYCYEQLFISASSPVHVVHLEELLVIGIDLKKCYYYLVIRIYLKHCYYYLNVCIKLRDCYYLAFCIELKEIYLRLKNTVRQQAR
jgi:hypothetical protein